MANTTINKNYRYFLYSRTQHESRKNVEARMNRKYVPGKVNVNGIWKEYTEISTTPNNIRYADMRVVAKGYIEDFKYTQSSSTSGVK